MVSDPSSSTVLRRSSKQQAYLYSLRKYSPGNNAGQVDRIINCFPTIKAAGVPVQFEEIFAR